jgi:hypothetical protein
MTDLTKARFRGGPGSPDPSTRPVTSPAPTGLKAQIIAAAGRATQARRAELEAGRKELARYGPTHMRQGARRGSR